MTHYTGQVQSFWTNIPLGMKKPGATIYFVLCGFLVGIMTGVVISIFRITTNAVYAGVLDWTAHDRTFLSIVAWFILAIVAALVVGWLVRNPAIRFGGEDWIKSALEDGQKHTWQKILFPKFLGSWLVMACGISVGREGPSIQMGAATALGLKKIYPQSMERRYFIIGGCACGLAAAFSAPFSGICYVYEVMREKISIPLFIFMLAGGIGVYVSATLLFGLDVMLPLPKTPVPTFENIWFLLPLGLLAGLVGTAYHYMIRLSIRAFARQKLLPPTLRPLAPFIAAAIMVLVFPAITGEGLGIFTSLEHGHSLMGYLCFFIIAKLVFTAFCYGSGIPAGLMVPVLCLGGVTGGVYGECLIALGAFSPDMLATCLAMGMCASFAAAERAPVTGIVLVTEMTGTFALSPSMLLVGAIGAFTARLCGVK